MLISCRNNTFLMKRLKTSKLLKKVTLIYGNRF